MKTIREYIDLIESAQTSVTESGRWIVKYWDKQPENTPAEHEFGSEEQAKAFLDELPAHYVKALRQDQGVAETSTVDGQVQDPGSQVWKLTSLSAEAARAKYGSNRVRVKSGGLRSGGDAVEVLVSLGGVSEDQATAKMGLMSAMGSNDNNPADQRRAMAQQAVERLATKR